MRRHLREFLYSYKNYVLTLRFAAYKTPQIYQLFFILQNLLLLFFRPYAVKDGLVFVIIAPDYFNISTHIAIKAT